MKSTLPSPNANTAPAGWVLCDGAAIPVQYTVLRSLFGTNMPDWRGRFPIASHPTAFPTGGGGLLHLHGIRVELRNGSGALASTYRQFASVFEEGGQPAILNLNSNLWTPTVGQLSTAFGFNFYVYCSDGADAFELTPNMGVYALELSVDATLSAATARPRRQLIRLPDGRLAAARARIR